MQIVRFLRVLSSRRLLGRFRGSLGNKSQCVGVAFGAAGGLENRVLIADFVLVSLGRSAVGSFNGAV